MPRSRARLAAVLCVLALAAPSCAKVDPPDGSCGDGICGASESCDSCAADCAAGCPGECGDGACGAGESCTSCAADCGACPGCGDGACAMEETCTSCAADCGPCGPVCGDGACSGTETCGTCAGDCGACPGCGDGACGPSESCTSCPSDCGVCMPVCGDGACDGVAETCSDCPSDCGTCPPACGDGTCDPATEACTGCPGDCGSCPSTCDGAACEPGETCLSCASDCGACAGTSCTPAESWPVPSCAATDAGDNGGAGSTDLTDVWPACSSFDTTGPEYTYVWSAPATGSVTVTLSGLGDDLDLFVFSDTGSGCAAGSMTCIGYSQNGCALFGGCDDESVTFTAFAGTVYYVVVDGYSGASGGYDLAIGGCSF